MCYDFNILWPVHFWALLVQIMTGEEEYVDSATQPLLNLQDSAVEERNEEMAMSMAHSPGTILLTPDPFHGLPVIIPPGWWMSDE